MSYLTSALNCPAKGNDRFAGTVESRLSQFDGRDWSHLKRSDSREASSQKRNSLLFRITAIGIGLIVVSTTGCYNGGKERFPVTEEGYVDSMKDVLGPDVFTTGSGMPSGAERTALYMMTNPDADHNGNMNPQVKKEYLRALASQHNVIVRLVSTPEEVCDAIREVPAEIIALAGHGSMVSTSTSDKRSVCIKSNQDSDCGHLSKECFERVPSGAKFHLISCSAGGFPQLGLAREIHELSRLTVHAASEPYSTVSIEGGEPHFTRKDLAGRELNLFQSVIGEIPLQALLNDVTIVYRENEFSFFAKVEDTSQEGGYRVVETTLSYKNPVVLHFGTRLFGTLPKKLYDKMLDEEARVSRCS